jgi:FG-GAP-like repeat
MKCVYCRLAVFALLLSAAAIRTFEAVPLESVSEFTANASIGDLNGDGPLDIVLAKGRHWAQADVVLFGDGKGHFTPGPRLPNKPDRSYSAPLADLNGDGSLDMVISNDARPEDRSAQRRQGKFQNGRNFR